MTLTIGESMFIARRRLGKSQSQMGKKHGMSRYVYGKIERDQVKGNIATQIIQYDDLKLYEKCTITRRRAEMTQDQLAEELKVSRFWINQMETGQADCQSLCNYWKIQCQK